MTDKPWTEPNLTSEQRASKAIQFLWFRETPVGCEIVREAIDAAVADAAPKWTHIDTASPSIKGEYAVIGETPDGEGPYKAVAEWNGDINEWITIDWQVAYWYGPLPAPPAEGVHAMTNDPARAILDDLFYYDDTSLLRYDDAGSYCGFCRECENQDGEIAHLDMCPYTRYRRMVEEEK